MLDSNINNRAEFCSHLKCSLGSLSKAFNSFHVICASPFATFLAAKIKIFFCSLVALSQTRQSPMDDVISC